MQQVVIDGIIEDLAYATRGIGKGARVLTENSHKSWFVNHKPGDVISEKEFEAKVEEEIERVAKVFAAHDAKKEKE